jgi:hypothetical protein
MNAFVVRASDQITGGALAALDMGGDDDAMDHNDDDQLNKEILISVSKQGDENFWPASRVYMVPDRWELSNERFGSALVRQAPDCVGAACDKLAMQAFLESLEGVPMRPCALHAAHAFVQSLFHALTHPTPCITVQADGGVKKTILVKGEGWEKPETGDMVRGGHAADAEAGCRQHAGCARVTQRACWATVLCSHRQCRRSLAQWPALLRPHARMPVKSTVGWPYLQCTTWAPWRVTAPSLTPHATVTSPSPSPWGRVSEAHNLLAAGCLQHPPSSGCPLCQAAGGNPAHAVCAALPGLPTPAHSGSGCTLLAHWQQPAHALSHPP